MKKTAHGHVFLATCSLALFLTAMAVGQSKSETVSSIVKAPVSPDGDVVGAATDFVINLGVDMDPSVPGSYDILQFVDSVWPKILMPITRVSEYVR